MQRAMEEGDRRRRIQLAYNEAYHITPTSIRKDIDNILGSVYEADYVTVPAAAEEAAAYRTAEELDRAIADLTARMKEAAGQMEFEKAAALRDRIRELEGRALEAFAAE